MSQPVLVKAYASIFPEDGLPLRELEEVCGQALGGEAPQLRSESGMLLLSFEGIYFPEEDFVAALQNCPDSRRQGKLDVLDLEDWLLRRYVFEGDETVAKKAPLNNVLDYSGH